MHEKFSKNFALCVMKSKVVLIELRFKFDLYFQSFHKLPLLLHDSGNFVKTENMCEYLSSSASLDYIYERLPSGDAVSR